MNVNIKKQEDNLEPHLQGLTPEEVVIIRKLAGITVRSILNDVEKVAVKLHKTARKI